MRSMMQTGVKQVSCVTLSKQNQDSVYKTLTKECSIEERSGLFILFLLSTFLCSQCKTLNTVDSSSPSVGQISICIRCCILLKHYNIYQLPAAVPQSRVAFPFSLNETLTHLIPTPCHAYRKRYNSNANRLTLCSIVFERRNKVNRWL